MSESISNQDKITIALHEVVDPEVGVNIVDLGLIYNIQVHERRIDVRMTMTTPACPLHSSISAEVKAVIQRHLGIQIGCPRELNVSWVGSAGRMHEFL
jgi:metal-sulfur cluster biosynthetic enzyme